MTSIVHQSLLLSKSYDLVGIPSTDNRKPDPLPEAGDVEGQGAFWKKHYNTPLGAGTVPKYVLKVTSTFKEV
jgi:hypothetical protein